MNYERLVVISAVVFFLIMGIAQIVVAAYVMGIIDLTIALILGVNAVRIIWGNSCKDMNHDTKEGI